MDNSPRDLGLLFFGPRTQQSIMSPQELLKFLINVGVNLDPTLLDEKNEKPCACQRIDDEEVCLSSLMRQAREEEMLELEEDTAEEDLKEFITDLFKPFTEQLINVVFKHIKDSGMEIRYKKEA